MNKKPKVLLIAPTCLDKKGKPIVQRKTYLPALTMAQLAAVTPDTVDVKIVSETSQPIPWDEHWDLVGVSGILTGYGFYQVLNAPEVIRVRIPVKGLIKDLDGIRIAQITDLGFEPVKSRIDQL